MQTSNMRSLVLPDPRNDFPFLQDNQRIYFDSSSTSLKPTPVIEAITDYYRNAASNVGRSNHQYAQLSSQLYEASRNKVAGFLGGSADEVIFTANCTDSINLVANALSLGKDDHVVVSPLEHHSNLLPWLFGCRVTVARLDQSGCIDLDHLDSLLAADPAKLVAVCHASNVTGNVQPVRQLCAIARARGALSLVDAAQTVGHIPVNVGHMACDFLALSGHKMFGPSGIGVLYVRRDLQASMKCHRYGGGMVNKVGSDDISFQSGPGRFEAGTPNIEGAIGLGAAVDYINSLGVQLVHDHDKDLERYFSSQIRTVRNIEMAFPLAPQHLPIFPIVPAGNVELGFVSRILSDRYDIAVSSGFQCNQPLYRSSGINGALRVSMHLYNTRQDIDRLMTALRDLEDLLA
ncbi:putative cysteine desulfurase [Pseudomonas sp. 24 E 13]|uniref:aminotransferase class V-fold PLP-dependent enzyme n=1 Tax=Pseudomonas sp. 24 E 13 TaxID=1844095 RepID=UPI0008124B99|nr:cysteine desulfurase [Pseudomonas sp. 24 E 13]CRM54690.1 putative cysteine desulfurase [Pseudomonas sp. 24 E 13]